MPLCNGADIGCVSYIDNITGRESGLTSLYGACIFFKKLALSNSTSETGGTRGGDSQLHARDRERRPVEFSPDARCR
jgi:hypothetical protein